MNPTYGNLTPVPDPAAPGGGGRGGPPEPRPRLPASAQSLRRALTVREQIDRAIAVLRHALRFSVAGAVVLTIGLIISAGVAATRPRVFRSEALLLYKERINPLDREQGANPGLRVGLRLRELVLSRSSLEKIITEMNLYEKMVEDQGMAVAVDSMRTRVGFKAREGATYALSFEGEEAQLVQEVTRRLTDALLRESQRSTVEVVAGTKEFLDAESQRMDEELKKREAALAKFLSAHPSFAVTPGSSSMGAGMAAQGKQGAPAAPRRRGFSDPRTEALEREIERIRLRLSPQATLPREVTPEVKAAVDEWKRREADAQREVDAAERDAQNARQSFTEEHPDVKRAKGRLETAARGLLRVKQEAATALQRLQPSAAPPPKPLSDAERRALEDEMGKLNQELSHYRGMRRESREGKDAKEAPRESPADDIVRQETEYAQLLRAVTEAQDQRKQLENKRFLAEMNERINVGDGGVGLVIIDPPYKPTRPARGGRMQAAMIGGAVALITALGLMLLLALLDDRIYSRDDIERLETLPLLVTVPLPDRALAKEMKAAARGAGRGAGSSTSQRAASATSERREGGARG